MGRFAAGVFAEQIQRIHRHPQLVRRLPALGGRIFQHDIFAPAGLIAGLDGALGHLQKLADAVRFMHHKIALLERQRVHLIAALGRPPLGVRNIADAVTGQVRFRHHDERQCLGVFELAHLGKDQARMAEGLIQGDLARAGFPAGGGHLGANALLGKTLHHALDSTLGRRDKCRTPASVCMRQQLGHHGIDLFDITARGGPRLKLERQGFLLWPGQHAWWGKCPQRLTGLANGDLQRLKGAVARSLSIEPFRGQGSIRTHGGSLPAGSEEFRVGLFQIFHAAPDLFRRHHHHVRGGGKELGEGDQWGIGKHGQNRLHALSRNMLADLGQKLHQRRVSGMRRRQCGRALCHRIRNRQLAGGKDIHATDLDFRDGALVSNRKLADIGDLIAPKLYAHRVIQGGGKDIDNATAGGKLTALGHHVHVLIRPKFQAAHHIIEVILVVFFQMHRGAALDVLQDGLGEPARGRNDNAQVINVVQHLRALADDIHARAQALVRQRLPRGKHRDLIAHHGG